MTAFLYSTNNFLRGKHIFNIVKLLSNSIHLFGILTTAHLLNWDGFQGTALVY